MLCCEWGNSGRHFLIRSMCFSQALTEPIQRQCMETTYRKFFCKNKNTTIHKCALKRKQYTTIHPWYIYLSFIIIILFGVFLLYHDFVLLHTAFNNASGLLSSCSAAALEMARSVSSCRCLESFVGDGCSMYSGSCWGTIWETKKSWFIIITDFFGKNYNKTVWRLCTEWEKILTVLCAALTFKTRPLPLYSTV